LVIAGLAQLEQRGADGFSLREAARSVGVTPMAAYHHFKDKKALLAAVAAAGYAEFTKRQRSAVESASTTLEAVIALGRCYVDNARAHPELFRLMVGRGLSGGLLDAEVARAFAVACDAVTRYSPGTSPTTVRHIAASAWAVAHGIAALLLDGVLQPGPLGFESGEALTDSLLWIHWRGCMPRGENTR
jgi:AcrR family transcriptional regulator